MELPDKPAAAKKTNGKVEAPAAAAAEAKKPVKVTPKTPAVDPKQVARVTPGSLTFLAAYHTCCCTVRNAASPQPCLTQSRVASRLRNAA